MPSENIPGLKTSLLTSLSLIEQFLQSLTDDKNESVPSADTPSPLLLLDVASATIKSQVTKLSLLTITSPFTPSAVANVLKPLNESILPSLVTATLLTTPTSYTAAFSADCRSSVSALLRDLQTLVRLVKSRSEDGKPTKEMSETEKKVITEQTGRVWAGCDQLVKLGKEGLPGFIARKANQWLELMKDAVKELEEWDPEEEVDPDDIFGQVGSEDEEEETENAQHKTELSNHRASISAGVKDQVLKVLSRIPQSIHVVVKQRLAKLECPPSTIPTGDLRSALEMYLTRIRTVSDMIDESAEAMYMGDPELCLKKAGEARAVTIEVVQAAQKPLSAHVSNDRSGGKETLYIERALDWITKVELGNMDKFKAALPG